MHSPTASAQLSKRKGGQMSSKRYLVQSFQAHCAAPSWQGAADQLSGARYQLTRKAPRYPGGHRVIFDKHLNRVLERV